MFRTLFVICALVVFAAAQTFNEGQLEAGDILLKEEHVLVVPILSTAHATVNYNGVNIIVGIISQIKNNQFLLLF